MIRISKLPVAGISSFRVEGRALGSFGEEFRKFVGEALDRETRIALDLEGLLSIDQLTLEFLAERRDSVRIDRAPSYLDRWLSGTPNGRPMQLRPATRVQRKNSRTSSDHEWPSAE
jgi:hypothetical protein